MMHHFLLNTIVPDRCDTNVHKPHGSEFSQQLNTSLNHCCCYRSLAPAVYIYAVLRPCLLSKVHSDNIDIYRCRWHSDVSRPAVPLIVRRAVSLYPCCSVDVRSLHMIQQCRARIGRRCAADHVGRHLQVNMAPSTREAVRTYVCSYSTSLYMYSLTTALVKRKEDTESRSLMQAKAAYHPSQLLNIPGLKVFADVAVGVRSGVTTLNYFLIL